MKFLSLLFTEIEMVNFDKFSPANIVEGKRTELLTQTIPLYLSKLEAIASSNGFLVNDKLSWADLYFTSMVEYMNWMMKANLIENYEKLSKIFTNVMAIENIKNYVAKRPNQ